jgi:hypothetical protein
VSWPYVVKHYVPEGMQRPSCSKPIWGATQTEQGQGAENNNLCHSTSIQIGCVSTTSLPRVANPKYAPAAINKKMASRERPTMSLVKRDSKNAGTITATAAKVAPSISTGTISSVLGSGIAR